MITLSETPKRRQIRAVLFMIVICTVFITGCTADKQDNSQAETVREFIVNKRTGRIHSPECPSVLQMSDKNKWNVSDTLLNLLKQDYVVCRRCGAGLNSSKADGFINHLLHGNLYGDEIPITASQGDYLKAIDEVSEWYVDHVPTYASRIQEEPYSKYTGQYKNYKTISLWNRGKRKSYTVLSADTEANSATFLSPDNQILRGSEKAVQNYSDCFRQIRFKRQIAYYPCDILPEDSDYNTPGDDCVRYMFTIFNRMDGQFTRKFHALTQSSYSKTNSKMIATDYEDIANGFSQLGFKIFDSTEREINLDYSRN